MTTSSIPKQSAGGLALAAVTVALGVYFGTKLASEGAGLFLLRLFYALAAAAVLKSVFIWGEARGFPIRREDGRLHFAHLFRNLVMAVIAIPVVLLLAAPLSWLAFQLAR
jgi:hypothetical protein